MEYQQHKASAGTNSAKEPEIQTIAELAAKHQWAVELTDEAGYDRDGRKYGSLLELETQLLADKGNDKEKATQEWYQSGLQYWKVTSSLST